MTWWLWLIIGIVIAWSGSALLVVMCALGAAADRASELVAQHVAPETMRAGAADEVLRQQPRRTADTPLLG
jgi:hypothetical protein